MKKILIFALLISCFMTLNAFSQQAPYTFTGRLVTKFHYYDIDNEENSTLIPHGQFNTTLFMLDREEDLNMHILADYESNKWDGHKFSKFHINITKSMYELDFGDFYEQLSPFTVYYKDLRGIRARRDFWKYKGSNRYRFKFLGSISQS